MLAHLTNNRLAVGVDHIIAGWIFFTLVVFLFFLIGLRWRESANVNSKVEATAGVIPGDLINAGSPKAIVLTALAAIAILSSVPPVAQRLLQSPTGEKVLLTLAPIVARPWEILEEFDAQWKPKFLGADGELLKSYIAGGQRVTLYIAYYGAPQRQGAELVSSENILADKKVWVPVSAGSARALVDRSVIKSGDRTRLLWS
jgi:Protein of unknown function (DUF3485)